MAFKIAIVFLWVLSYLTYYSVLSTQHGTSYVGGWRGTLLDVSGPESLGPVMLIAKYYGSHPTCSTSVMHPECSNRTETIGDIRMNARRRSIGVTCYGQSCIGRTWAVVAERIPLAKSYCCADCACYPYSHSEAVLPLPSCGLVLPLKIPPNFIGSLMCFSAPLRGIS